MSLKYQHLVGLPFNMERQNCYHLIRRFYWDNYEIELPDYPCPTDWWARGLNLYADLTERNNFDITHDHARNFRPGDLISMAINSPVGNHIAVVLDNGKILHHLVGQLSRTDVYGGMYRNTTVGVYRHRVVGALKPPENTVDIKELLPPHVARRLQQMQLARSGAAEETGSEGST